VGCFVQELEVLVIITVLLLAALISDIEGYIIKSDVAACEVCEALKSMLTMRAWSREVILDVCK
jgi:hypothetical protein